MPRPAERRRRQIGRGAAILAAWLAAAPVLARPPTVEDLLRREGFGAAQVDPTGRWLSLERRGPYAQAVRFDLGTLDDLARTTLWAVDLRKPGPARPLVHAQPHAAYAAGPFAPDGRRMAVYRLSPGDWELGVVTLATRRVRWLGVTPERIDDATTVAWSDAETLIVIARPDRDPPYDLRLARMPALLLPARWAASARGERAVTVVGSGRYLDVRPPAPIRRLLSLDPRTGRRTVLARGAFVDLALSPDRRRAALLETGGDIPMDPAHAVQGPYGLQHLTHRLRVLDLAARTMSAPCPDRDLLLHPLIWSPSSRALLVFGRADGAPWAMGHLLRADPATGACRPIDVGLTPVLDSRPEAARAGWLGEDPLVWARVADAPANAPPAWMRLTATGPVSVSAGLADASRDALAVTSDGLLFAAGGGVWRMTPDGTRTLAARGVGPVAFAQISRLWTFEYDLPRGGRLLGRAPGPGPDGNGDRLVAVTAAGSKILARLPPDAEVLGAVGAEGALVRTRPSGGAETLQWVTADKPPVTVAAINSYLAGIDAPIVRRIAHRGPSGEALNSWLILPRRHPGDPPPPLIVRPYLGRSHAQEPTDTDFRNVRGDKTPSLLAAQGYAVLIPSLPHRTDGRDPVEGLAGRVLEIVDAAAADPDLRGAFDPTRLGLWGISFGGFSTLAILTQTHRFQAAIAEASTSDLMSEWGVFQTPRAIDPSEGLSPFYTQGWVENLQADMRVTPWTDPDRYRRNSPVWAADKVTTPLLLIHGDQDSFALAQPQEMFSALLRQNKDAELAVYWGQGHIIGGPGNLRDLYARAFAWFGSHLRGAGPRDQ